MLSDDEAAAPGMNVDAPGNAPVPDCVSQTSEGPCMRLAPLCVPGARRLSLACRASKVAGKGALKGRKASVDAPMHPTGAARSRAPAAAVQQPVNSMHAAVRLRCCQAPALETGRPAPSSYAVMAVASIRTCGASAPAYPGCGARACHSVLCVRALHGAAKRLSASGCTMHLRRCTRWGAQPADCPGPAAHMHTPLH